MWVIRCRESGLVGHHHSVTSRLHRVPFRPRDNSSEFQNNPYHRTPVSTCFGVAFPPGWRRLPPSSPSVLPLATLNDNTVFLRLKLFVQQTKRIVYVYAYTKPHIKPQDLGDQFPSLCHWSIVPFRGFTPSTLTTLVNTSIIEE